MTITTTKSPQGRIRVSTSGITGMDKVVNYAFDVIDNGEDVILKNEHGDTCTLDDSLFLHGIYNVKFAIRQFAKGERVTGAIVLNGKEYPVVKAEVRRAEEERRRAMREVSDNPTWEDPHKYETVGDLEHARHLYSEFNTDSNAGEVSEEIAADAVVETTNDTSIDTDETAAADNKTEYLCVNDDEIQFKNGKFFRIWSYAYDAGFYADAANYAIKFHCIGGNETNLFDDEEAFFEVMEERGACTIDAVYKPTRPLVKTLYFNGDHWYHVKLEEEIVNCESLLFDKDELLIVESGRHAAKIMYLPNGDIAYFVRYLDDRQWYGDFVRVDENEFWLAMADREACTLEPVNNELIVADYELADKYNEFGEDTRRFLVNGEIITFCKGRWFEINSPKIRANINRSIYYNKINYNLDEWSHPRYHELSQYHVTAAKFWWSMYKRGFMQRATPFKITIEHVDAPATVHEVTDLYISYTPNGKKYDMFVDDGEIIVLATVDDKRIFDFAESIRLAFANSAGVTIDSKGEITIIADEDIYILDSCAEINRHAPEGWTITFDTKGKFFPVKFNGKQVTKLDSLATQKFLSPEKFFEQFKPLVDKKFTPRDQFLADRYNELDMLEQMREEIADDDVAQLKTLEEMINQVKRDIAAAEFAC